MGAAADAMQRWHLAKARPQGVGLDLGRQGLPEPFGQPLAGGEGGLPVRLGVRTARERERGMEEVPAVGGTAALRGAKARDPGFWGRAPSERHVGHRAGYRSGGRRARDCLLPVLTLSPHRLRSLTEKYRR